MTSFGSRNWKRIAKLHFLLRHPQNHLLYYLNKNGVSRKKLNFFVLQVGRGVTRKDAI